MWCEGRGGDRVCCKSDAASTQLTANVTGSICVYFGIYYDRTLQLGRREYDGVNMKGECTTFILKVTVGWPQPTRALCVVPGDELV